MILIQLDARLAIASAVRANAAKAAQEMIKAMTINIPAGYNSATYAALLGSATVRKLTIPPYVMATHTGINGILISMHSRGSVITISQQQDTGVQLAMLP